MDVAQMLPMVEPPPAKPSKGAGKTAAEQGDGDAGFAGLFADLVAGEQPAVADGEKQVLSDTVAPPQAMSPLLWALLPLMPATVVANQNQPTQAAPSDTAPPMAAAGAPTPLKWLPPVAQNVATVVASPTMPAAEADTTAAMPQIAGLPTAVAEPRLTPTVVPATAQPTVQTAAQPSTATQLPNVPVAAAPAMPIAPANIAVQVTKPVEPVETVPLATDQVTETAAPQTVSPAIAQVAAPAPAPKASPAPTPDAEPVSAAPAVAITAAAASEEAPDTGEGNPGFAADTAATTAPPVMSADVTAAPAFATLVEHRLSISAASEAARSDAPARPAAADPHDVAGQIVDSARLIARAENSEMVIRLKPEHLGELTLKIVVDSGVVSATFHTASAEVRGAIEASLPQLRQDMAGQGLKVDNVGVYTSLDHFFANDQHQTPQQQTPQQTRSRGDDDSYMEAAAAIAAPTHKTAGGGIDYRV